MRSHHCIDHFRRPAAGEAEGKIMSLIRQVDIGSHYLGLSRAEVVDRIAGLKERLADRLLILCHHYQGDDIYRFADLTGDSLKLAREAAAVENRKYLVFCGVHFMAESADILARDEQVVILPHLDAGCPMADMASRGAVERSWEELATGAGVDVDRVVPVTYVNSSAEVKAFVGERGGSVCTSSNARRVLEWALGRGEKVFFFPDQHLGRNAAHALGIDAEKVVLWRRGEELGGNTPERLRRATVILWDGYCEVHMRFLPEQIRRLRTLYPQIRIIVHPESRFEVVREADLSGSTEAIITAVEESPAGSHWAIGTEINLVERLSRLHPDKRIDILADSCLCATMAAVTPVTLLWVLENLHRDRVVNRIRVEGDVAEQAQKALGRMLNIR